jgi:hypothetical protein
MDKSTILKGKYIYENTNEEKKGFSIEVKVTSKGGQLDSNIVSQIEQQYMNSSNNIGIYRKIVKD